jgi:ABC-type transport system involved in multi-copper enzyme maturation permease subunit
MLSTLPSLLKAEFRHQRYIIQQGRVGLVWIVLAALLIVPALVATAGFMAVTLLNDDPTVVAGLFASGPNQPGTTLPLLAVLVSSVSMLVVVTFITYGLAANSITRERRGNTWDNLRLTGASAFSIVLGKWIASLLAVWGDHLIAVALRVGLVSYLLLIVRFNVYAWADLPDAVVLAMWGLVLWYGVLDAGATAAIGILGAAVEGAAGAWLALLLVGLRLGLMAAAAAWCYIALLLVFEAPLLLVWHTLVGTLFYASVTVVMLWFAQRHVG